MISLRSRSKRLNMNQRKTVWGYIFILPALIGLAVFYLGPMIYSFIIGFYEWDTLLPAKFVGVRNYVDMFTKSNSLVVKSLLVTLSYSAITVPLVTVVSLFIAVLLNSNVKGLSVFRTIYYIPSIVPAVANSALWIFLCNPMFGLLNALLKLLGLPPSNWIYDAKTVIPTLAFIALWGSGNTVIIYLAGLQGISRTLYEAVEVDGGDAWKKFIHITVPIMSPIIFYNMVMAIISSMQTFTQAYIMTDGGPNNASLFYVLLLYRTAFKNQQMGYACAMAWVLFIIIALLTFAAFRLSNKWVFYGGEQS